VPELKASLEREEIIHFEGVISSQAGLAVEELPGVVRAARAAVNGHTQLTVVVQDQRALLPRLIETLAAHDAVVQKIVHEEVTLEDVFIARTGRTLAEDTRMK
jgi:ABC-type uncharacterized transport system ATPase subunit